VKFDKKQDSIHLSQLDGAQGQTSPALRPAKPDVKVDHQWSTLQRHEAILEKIKLYWKTRRSTL
jgi:hypothetical protein